MRTDDCKGSKGDGSDGDGGGRMAAAAAAVMTTAKLIARLTFAAQAHMALSRIRLKMSLLRADFLALGRSP